MSEDCDPFLNQALYLQAKVLMQGTKLTLVLSRYL